MIIYVDVESRSPLDIAEVGNEQYINYPLTRPVCVTVVVPEPKRQTLVWVNAALWPTAPRITGEMLRPCIPPIYGEVGDLIVTVSQIPPILIIKTITQREATAVAHNATGFDKPFWERKFDFQPARWLDTLPWCRCAGLPGQLDLACTSLFGIDKHEASKLAHHVFKDDGKPPKLGLLLPFIAYNICDVLLLERLHKELLNFADNFDCEREVIATHDAINERGILCDRELVRSMLDLSHKAANKAGEEIERLTGGAIKKTDLRRTEFIREWVEQHGLKMPNLRKDTVKQLIANPSDFLSSVDDTDCNDAIPSIDPVVMDVLRLRVAATRTTSHKLQRIEQIVGRDNRIRHVIVYGQAHTGRFSSRKVQLHNMTKGMGKLDVGKLLAEPLTWERCVEVAGKNSVDDVIATLMRSVFVALPDGWLLVADFSSIEARGIAWIADEKDLLSIFASGGDPYVEMASTVFGVPVASVTKDQRQLGKIIVLGCIAEGTPVLTNHGWKPIERVTLDDLVWDGIAWVRHDGLIERGERECINVNGVWLTPDHEVLTDVGWKQAWELNGNTPVPLSGRFTETGQLRLLSAGRKAESIEKCNATTNGNVRKRTFDLRNAGPRNRFQCRSLICHNCGYGMSAFKFAITCANWGVSLEAAGVTAEQCVEAYRGRFTKIAGVQSEWGRKGGVWQALHDATLSAVQHNVTNARLAGKCWIAMWRGHLIIELPSGRQLVYRNARVENVIPQYARFVANEVRPKPTVFYDHPFGKRNIYGGLLSENIVQAICRDLMVAALVKVEAAGLRPVLHVHDEIVCETSDTNLGMMLQYMTVGPSWSKGFPIEAKGYATRRYGKSAIGWDGRERIYRNGELIQ